MKTIFNTLTINYSEYSYFKSLKASDRVNFFFEVYEAEVLRLHMKNEIDLTGFFSSMNEQLSEQDNSQTSQSIEVPEGSDKIDVMIDDENIMVESNSLTIVRHIIYKFIESGYILRRDKDMEKTFKRDKVTKYLRIFKIIDQTSSICIN